MKTKMDTYPELLADLAEQLALKLREHGIESEKAAEAGFFAADYVRTHWGGQKIYLLKGVQYEFHMRDMKIFEQFDGHNHAELAKEYNLTEVRIYQIVKAVKAELIRKRQGALF